MYHICIIYLDLLRTVQNWAVLGDKTLYAALALVWYNFATKEVPIKLFQ